MKAVYLILGGIFLFLSMAVQDTLASTKLGTLAILFYISHVILQLEEKDQQ